MSQHDAAALPYAELKISGQVLKLKMGYLCLVSLQKLWGLKSYRDVQAHIANNMEDITLIGELIWGMTRSHHEDMTLQDVAKFIDAADDLGELMASVGEALNNGSPPESPKEGQVE